jgi:arylsulfatase A-like enzyme
MFPLRSSLRAPLARVGLIWALLSAALFALLAVTPSYLVAAGASRSSRAAWTAGLLAWTWLVTSATAGAVGAAGGRFAPRAGRALRTALALLLWLGIAFEAVSWIAFRSVGTFLSPGHVRFFLADAAHTVRLTTPSERVAVLLGLAAATLIWLLVVTAFRGVGAEAWTPRSRRGLAAACAVAAVVFACAFFLYPRLAADGPQYRARACYRSTPGLAMLCDALTAAPAAVATVKLQPVISLEAYLATLDRARLKRPNVLLIVVESQRRDSLRALGGTRNVMPFLDGLGEQALLFTNAYAQSNATDYAIPAILSSLYPLKHREHDVFRGGTYPRTLIHDVLKGVGYRTGVFSSSNDKWANVVGFYSTPALDVVFYPEVYEGETIVAPQDTGFIHRMKEGIFQKGTLDDAVTVDRFLSWVSEGPSEQPFFAFLNLQTAHFPYQMAFTIDTPFEPSALDFDASFGSYPFEKRAVMRNRYDNSLHRVDGEIRRAVAGLEGMGHGGRTMLVVVGDHGQEFFEHGRVTHGQLMHQEVLQVPLLIAGPSDIVPRRKDDRPVQHVDIPPTVLGLLGFPPHPNFQGADVLAAGGDAYGRKLFMATQHLFHQNVLVWRGLKYVMDSRGEDALFDLGRDPGETRNLLTARPETAAEYRRIAEHWYRVQLSYYDDPQNFAFYPPGF